MISEGFKYILDGINLLIGARQPAFRQWSMGPEGFLQNVRGKYSFIKTSSDDYASEKGMTNAQKEKPD